MYEKLLKIKQKGTVLTISLNSLRRSLDEFKKYLNKTSPNEINLIESIEKCPLSNKNFIDSIDNTNNILKKIEEDLKKYHTVEEIKKLEVELLKNKCVQDLFDKLKEQCNKNYNSYSTCAESFKLLNKCLVRSKPKQGNLKNKLENSIKLLEEYAKLHGDLTFWGEAKNLLEK